MSLIAKSTFLFVVFLFLIAVWSGVNCLFWLFSKVSSEEKLKKLQEDHAEGMPDADYVSKQSATQTALDKDRKRRAQYHYVMLWAFALAVLLSVVLLGCGIFSPAAPVEKKEQTALEDRHVNQEKMWSARFLVTQSAIHQTAHGKEAHTFLLDQEKGVLWVMTCKYGKVEFQRVQTVNSVGEPEDPSK